MLESFDVYHPLVNVVTDSSSVLFDVIILLLKGVKCIQKMFEILK